jgi:membrane-associated protein
VLFDPAQLIADYGAIGIFVILFLETGFLLGLLLPGETLTIVAGAYSHQTVAGTPHPDLAAVMAAAALGAILGGQLGYLLGRRVGPSLLDRPDGRVFKRRYVDWTHEHFERYGPRTLLIARFLPFIRTIVNPAAGIGRMDAGRFALFNAVGGVFWAVTVTMVGYVMGGLFNVDRYALLVTIGVVVASVAMLMLHQLWQRSRTS